MNRSFYALPAVLCLTAAIVTAQAPAGEKPAGDQPRAQEPATPKPSTPPATPSTPPASSQSAAGKVTYTGCLKQGESAGSWILENAEAAAKPGASAPGAVGTSGASKTTFSLDPAATVNLTPHANHKIEVVGMVAPAKPGGGATAPKQAINVDSLKMVSATCP